MVTEDGVPEDSSGNVCASAELHTRTTIGETVNVVEQFPRQVQELSTAEGERS